MESVGQKLCQARLRLGLTLEAVSSSTRISLRSLLAIESDQLDQISSRFLYKSFVRQFGQAVGLDGAELEQDLMSAAGSMPEPLVPGQGGAPLPPVAAPSRHRKSRVSRWIYSLGSLAVTLTLCSGLYAFWETARTQTPKQLIAALVSNLRLETAHTALGKPAPAAPEKMARSERAALAVAPTPGAATVATKETGGEPAGTTAANAASNTAAPKSAAADVFHIQVSAIEQSWLSVVTDGREVYSGILRTAETKTLEGHDLARIRTGNAGGVEVVFNGRNLGALGSRGQVRTVLFNRNGYEVLQPQAILQANPFLHVDFRP